MGDYRKPIFVTDARRKSQNRLAQRRLRERRRAEQEDRNPALSRAKAAEREERGAAAALCAAFGANFDVAAALEAHFDAERIFRAVARYRAAFQERVASARGLETVKLRKRRLDEGANPLLHVDLLGR